MDEITKINDPIFQINKKSKKKEIKPSKQKY